MFSNIIVSCNQTSTTFSPVHQQDPPKARIGVHDLWSPNDRAFTFDYEHSGKLDHLVLYRPGSGTIWILKNVNGTFSPVQHGDPGSGIGRYDLRSPRDRLFAFDYDHSGKLDHLVCYRPGTGTVWILQNVHGMFSPVYQQGDPGAGIGKYDLLMSGDRAFAFDYDHSGKLDHLVFYRPGTGTMWILKNVNGTFSAVYQQGCPGSGIGDYDLGSPHDRALAFDYEHSGKLDHLVLYRPGTGTIWILKNVMGVFSRVHHQGNPGFGIGGYDLGSLSDRVITADYEHTGKHDHLVFYRPGMGIIWILKNVDGLFSPVYWQGDSGNENGGFALMSSSHRVVAFDYDHSGKFGLYQLGTSAIWMLKD